MSNSIGDLKINIFLEILNAEKNAKKFSASLKDVEVQSDKVKASTVSLSDKIAGAGLRVDGFRAIIDVLRGSFGNLLTEYNKQEIALAKLTNGLKNVGEGASALNKLSQQSSDLQKVTPFADEDINNAQAMLTTFQKNSTEIEILTPRILDLAAAYQTSGESGMDLQQVAVMLGKVNEETIGGLRRVGVAFTKEQEEKLKSLKGTEQAIYLSEILDSNFKGMAETLGNTTAGKMAIFENEVGEIRESLGKLLSEGLVPFLNILKPLVESLANAGPVVQRLTLGVIAMGAAFVVINTSLGGMPYIIGGIITLIYSLGGAFDTTSEQVKNIANETRKSIDVTTDMKDVLDKLGISANNMAKAYDGIANSIGSMTKTQLLSTKAFIEAEKSKVLALINTLKVMKLQELADMDFVPPDRGKSIENAYSMGFGTDLGKYDEILSDIELKLKFIKGDDTGFSPNTKTSSKNSAEETIKLTNELIDKEAELIELLKIEETFTAETRNQMVYVNYLEKVKDLKKQIAALKLDKDTIDVKSSIATVDIGLESSIKEVDSPLKKKTKELTPKDKLDEGISAAQNIASILGFGADNFVSKLIAGLNNGISLVSSIAKILSLFGSGGLTGIFSVLGLASGGMVPGSGSGDSVPAMLTPGEFVINKSRAGQLGTGFLQWLNGGGSVQSMAPGAFANLGNTSQVIEVPYIVTHKVEGNDLRTILSRVDKTNNRRKL